LSQSALKVNVFSMVPFGVSTDAFQVPEASAINASENIVIKAATQNFIVYAPSPASVPLPALPRINSQ
jgi:hypothetical protein